VTEIEQESLANAKVSTWQPWSTRNLNL